MSKPLSSTDYMPSTVLGVPCEQIWAAFFNGISVGNFGLKCYANRK